MNNDMESKNSGLDARTLVSGLYDVGNAFPRHQRAMYGLAEYLKNVYEGMPQEDAFAMLLKPNLQEVQEEKRELTMEFSNLEEPLDRMYKSLNLALVALSRYNSVAPSVIDEARNLDDESLEDAMYRKLTNTANRIYGIDKTQSTSGVSSKNKKRNASRPEIKVNDLGISLPHLTGSLNVSNTEVWDMTYAHERALVELTRAYVRAGVPFELAFSGLIKENAVEALLLGYEAAKQAVLKSNETHANIGDANNIADTFAKSTNRYLQHLMGLYVDTVALKAAGVAGDWGWIVDGADAALKGMDEMNSDPTSAQSPDNPDTN